jgi:hypothetical protein
VSDSAQDGDDFERLLHEVAHVPSVDPAALGVEPDSIRDAWIGKKLSHFRIVSRIGVGGMGVVYRAEDEDLHRTVAIKVLHRGVRQKTERAALLRREARLTAALNHPRIATIFEIGQAEGVEFIAMELVEGRSLRAHMMTRPLSARQVLECGRQIAEGLAHAHRAGVVHRDLKPENILLTSALDVKILDFGLATSIVEPDRQIVGTPRYMPPEVEEGCGAGPPADVWCFGVVMSELAGDAMQRRLRRIVARCLDPNPRRRYPDGSALFAALTFDRRPLALYGTAALLFALIIVAVLGAIAPRSHSVTAGGAHRRLTAKPADVMFTAAAYAPDGRRIAYVASAKLFVDDLVEKSTREVALEDLIPGAVAFAPDSTTLYLVATRTSTPVDVLCAFEPARPRCDQLAEGGFERLAISSAGEIALVTNKEIEVRDALGRNPRRLLSLVTGEHIGALSWAPGGGRLAVMRVVTSNRRIAIETIGAHGEEGTSLVSDPRLAQPSGLYALTWAGNELIYALAEAPPKESSALFALPVDERSGRARGDAVELTELSGAIIAELDTDRSGKQLTYLRFEAQEDVWTGEIDQGGGLIVHASRLTTTERDERPSGWSADGRRVLWYVADEEGIGIFERGPDDPAPLPVGAGDPGDISWPQATKDALYYLRTPHDAKAHELEVVRASGGRRDVVWQQSIQGPRGPWWRTPHETRFRCTTSGQCFVSELTDKDLVLRRLGGETSADPLVRLERDVPYLGWGLSGDGAKIVVPRSAGRLAIVDLASGSVDERKVAAECLLQYAIFGPKDGELIATGVCAGADHYRIFDISPDGSVRTLRSSAHTWLSSPQLSQDGRRIAWGERPFDSDVWLYERAR